MSLDNKTIKSAKLLSLNEIEGAMLVSSGEFNLFLIELKEKTAVSYSFIRSLSKGDSFPKIDKMSFEGADYVYGLIAVEDSKVEKAENFDKDTWLKNLSDVYLSKFTLKLDTQSDVYLDFIIQVKNKEIARAKLNFENQNMTEMSLTRKVGELGELASIDLLKKTTQEKKLNTLYLSMEEVSKAYTLPFEKNRDILLDEKLAEGERIEKFCQDSEWRVRKVKLESDFYKKSSMPILAFRKSTKESIVIFPNSDKTLYFEPSKGGEKLPFTANLLDDISQDAYLFYELFPEGQITKKKILEFIFRNSKGAMGIVFAIGFISSLLAFIMPVATSYITGNVIPTANVSALFQISTLLIVLLLCQILLNIVPTLIMLMISTRRYERFQAAVYDHILRVPLKALNICDAGDMTGRVLGATEIQKVVFDVISGQFMSSLFALTSLAMMFYYSKSLALVGILMVFVYAIVFFLLSRLNIKPLAVVAEQGGKSSGFTKQIFEGVSKVRSAGAEQRVLSRFMDNFSIITKMNYKVAKLGAYQDVLSSIFPMLISIVFYAMAGGFFETSLSFPIFLAFMAAFQNFQGGVVGLSGSIWTLLAIKPEIDRIMPILEANVENNSDKHSPNILNADIEISHLSFSYAKDSPLVLDDVSIHAKAGEFIAIVGSSGAGKSTLVRLLLGFENYEKGAIYYSGKELANLNLRALRKQLGVVLQNTKIMAGSILDNIVMGTNYTQEDAFRALELASFRDEVEEMPMGIHTMVNPDNISGGQQQRILIARALVSSPVAVIMDESTSALDNITQEIVKKNMEKLNMTRIVIAHRLSTIINADRIYVLDNAKVAEVGTYQELLKQNGIFKELASRQQLMETS